MTNHPNRSRTTYTIQERGLHWIVSANGAEVTRYRKDEIAWSGYTDVAALMREIRDDLRLRRFDRVVIEE